MKYSVTQHHGWDEDQNWPFCDVNLDKEEIQLDFQRSVNGDKKLYIHVNGITIFRVQFKNISVKNELEELQDDAIADNG